MAKSSYALRQMDKFIGPKGSIQSDGNSRYWCKIGCYIVSFIDQRGEAICCHVRREDDITDISTDYFAGHYTDNITQALRYADQAAVRDMNRELETALPFKCDHCPRRFKGIDALADHLYANSELAMNEV